MPLSSVIGAQSLVQPGVCTSGTRPASPFDGQVIYETDTDKTLVYNGAGWVFLSTSRANPGALDLITSASFTASSSISVVNCFSSTYKNYKVIFNIDTANSATSRTIRMRLKTSSGDDSAAVYYYGSNLGSLGSTSNNQAQSAYAATELIVSNYYGYTDSTCNFSIDVISPEVSTVLTRFHGTVTGGDGTAMAAGVLACQIMTAKSNTGFSVYPSTGTISGNYAVYGYAA